MQQIPKEYLQINLIWIYNNFEKEGKKNYKKELF